MGRRLLPKRITPSVTKPLTSATTWGISSPFELLSPSSGQITNALLTRSPLRTIANPSFDLHVLSTPPAFILSQDQTLRLDFLSPCGVFKSLQKKLKKFTGSLYHSSVVKVRYFILRYRDQTPMSYADIGCQTKHSLYLALVSDAETSFTGRHLKFLAICSCERDLLCSKCVAYYMPFGFPVKSIREIP
jgi:hypothetical protein